MTKGRKPSSSNYHEIHNQDLAVIKALNDPKKSPPPTKQEQYIRQWQTIKPVFHMVHRSGLNTIGVPYKDENSQPTDDPDKASTWQHGKQSLILYKLKKIASTQHRTLRAGQRYSLHNGTRPESNWIQWRHNGCQTIDEQRTRKR
jgi:hypothetical protein